MKVLSSRRTPTVEQLERANNLLCIELTQMFQRLEVLAKMQLRVSHKLGSLQHEIANMTPDEYAVGGQDLLCENVQFVFDTLANV